MATEPIILPQPTVVPPPALEVVPPPAAPKKRSRGMLAVLITLFLLSWGLVLTVMTFQDITINAQRLLILDLFRDSSQLSAMRMKEAQKNHPAPGGKSATTNKDKGKAQNKAAKPRQRMTTPTPQLPDGPDVSDARRVQISI